MEKIKELAKYSNFDKAQDNAFNYLGDDAVLFYSPKPDKKYRIYDPYKINGLISGRWATKTIRSILTKSVAILTSVEPQI
jgi:hypothetical protein